MASNRYLLRTPENDKVLQNQTPQQVRYGPKLTSTPHIYTTSPSPSMSIDLGSKLDDSDVPSAATSAKAEQDYQEIHSLKQKLSLANQHIEDLGEELQRIEDDKKKLMDEVEALKRVKWGSQNSSRSSHNSDHFIAVQDDESSGPNNQTEDFREQIKRLRKEYEDVEEDNYKLRQEKQQVDEVLEKKEQQLKERNVMIRDLEQELAHSQEQKTKLAMTNEAKDYKISALQQECVELRQQINDINNEISVRRKSLSMNGSLSFSHFEPKDMAQEVVDLQLRDAKEELQKCEEQLEEARDHLSQKSAELSEVKQRAETSRKQLEQERDGLMNDKQAMETLVRDTEKLNKHLCDLMESVKAEYEAKINGLEVQISELSSSKKILEDEKKQQHDQIAKLEIELQATKIDYSNRVSTLQTQIDVLSADSESKQRQLMELREDLSTRIKEAEKADLKFQELQEELNDAFGERENLTKEIRTMEQEKTELESLNKQQVAESESLKTDIQGLVKQLSQLAREKGELDECNRQMDNTIVNTKLELETIQKTLSSIMLERQSLSQELVATQEALGDSEKNGKKLEEQVAELQTNVDGIRKALSAAKTLAHDLKKANEELEVQIESLCSDHKARGAEFEATIAALRSSVKDIQEQKQQMEQNLAQINNQLMEERSNAVKESAELTAMISSLTMNLATERELTSSLTTSLKEKCAQVEDAQSKGDQLVQDLAAKSSECELLNEKLQKTFENATQLTSANKRQEEEICSLKVQHDASSTEYERKIQSLFTENETTSKLLNEKEKLLDQQSVLLTKSEASVQSKEKEILFLNQQCNHMKTELCETLARVADLEKLLKETETTLANEQSKLEASYLHTEKLAAERSKLEEDLKNSKCHLESIIQTLQEKIELTQLCNANLETVSVQQVKDITELRTEIEMMACKAKSETEELQQALMAKEAELCTEKQIVQDLQSSLDETLRSLQTAKHKAAGWENDYNAAMSEVESLAVEANKLKDLNSESESKINELTGNLEALQEKFRTEVQRLEELLQKERDGYQKEMEGARNRIQDLTSELANIKKSSEAEVDRLLRIGSTDKDRIQKLENDIHAIMTTTEDLKSSSDSKITALAAQLEDKTKLIESQKNEIAAIEATSNETCSKYAEEIAVLSETIRHFEEEIQSLNASTITSKEESQAIQKSLMQELEAAKLKIESYESEIQRLKSEVTESEERQKAHIQECQNRETDLTQKLSDAHKNYSGLLGGAHEKIKKLQHMVQEQESSKCDVTKQIAEVRTQAIEETKEKYKQRCAEFQKNAFEAIDEFKVKNDELEKKLFELRNEMVKLQDENNQLKEKNEKMDEENNKLLRDRGILRRDLLECQQKIHSMEQLGARREDNNGTFRVPSTANLHRRLHTSDNSLTSLSSASSILGSTNFMDAETVLRSHDSGMHCGSERRLSTASVASNISNTSTSSDKFKAVPTGTGSLFTCEDEDEFHFHEKNIAELKYRRQTGTALLPGLPRDRIGGIDSALDARSDKERFSELYRRNTMVPQHLKSCYPSEMMMCDDEEIDETKLKQFSNDMMRAKSGPALRSKEDMAPPASSLSSSSLKPTSKAQLRNGVPATAQRAPFTIV